MDCATALARLGARYPAWKQAIGEKLEQAITDSEFEKPDKFRNLPAHEYAFEGLWQLMESANADKISSLEEHVT